MRFAQRYDAGGIMTLRVFVQSKHIEAQWPI